MLPFINYLLSYFILYIIFYLVIHLSNMVDMCCMSIYMWPFSCNQEGNH